MIRRRFLALTMATALCVATLKPAGMARTASEWLLKRQETVGKLQEWLKVFEPQMRPAGLWVSRGIFDKVYRELSPHERAASAQVAELGYLSLMIPDTDVPILVNPNFHDDDYLQVGCIESIWPAQNLATDPA